MEPAEHLPDQAPAHVHSDALPPWLAPGVNPVPPGPLSKPAVAWGGTLAATALMVAFGLWLGEVPAPPPGPVVRAAPVPLAARPAPDVPDVPPLVMAEPAPQAPSSAPAAGPIAASLAAPAAPVAAAMPAVRQRPVSVISRPAAVRHRTMLAGTRQTPRVQARVAAPSIERTRLAVFDRGEGQRIRCKHGELARECLARYR